MPFKEIKQSPCGPLQHQSVTHDQEVASFVCAVSPIDGNIEPLIDCLCVFVCVCVCV